MAVFLVAACAAMLPAISGFEPHHAFELCFYGGSVGGRAVGQYAALTLLFGQAAVYTTLVSTAERIRPPSALVPRLRTLHNVGLAIFSGSIAVAALWETLRSCLVSFFLPECCCLDGVPHSFPNGLAASTRKEGGGSYCQCREGGVRTPLL